MVSLIVGLIFVSITFYVSMIYTSLTLAITGFAQILLIIAAQVCLVYRKVTMSALLNAPVSMTERGNNISVWICVDNDSKLTCTRSKYRLSYYNVFEKRKKKIWLKGKSVFPDENRFEIRLKPDEAGSYVFSLDKMKIYDITGLFSISKKRFEPASQSIKVLPDIHEVVTVLTEPLKNFFGDADVYDNERAGYDSSEIFKIRPFQDGDKIQSIHWKLSAKTDVLMVKESSLPKACPVVLFLEYAAGRKTKHGNLNAYLSVIASVSFSMMDAGCPHFVVWYSESIQDIVRFRVDDDESFYTFLNHFMEDGFTKSSHNLKADYSEKYRGEHYLHALWFDKKLELKCDEKVVNRFTENTWQKDLKETELIL